MIVEKPDILKQWMADVLQPMCDAEPTKLARYVLALVRKSSSEERLRATMLDNLHVFLHERAGPFVDELLAALQSGSYVTRPPENRVVTLPTPLPPRRQVHLPPREGTVRTDSRPLEPASVGERFAGSTSPPRPSSDVTDRSRRSRSRSRSRSPTPTRGTELPGRSGPDCAAAPVTDLRLRLGGALGRRRCRDFDERGVCLSGDDCPFEHGADKLVLHRDSGSPVMTPFSPPQPPPAAAATEPYRPDAPGLTAAVWRPSLPAGAARQLTTAAPGRPDPTEQGVLARLDSSSSLHLRGVPPQLNQIMPLNDHLSRFGRIVNIQVPFGGDFAAALVTFSRPEEAEAALSAPEPVLGCQQITARPYAERPTTNGKQMVLSGLTRTVENPEAARRLSEQETAAAQSQNHHQAAAQQQQGQQPAEHQQQQSGLPTCAGTGLGPDSTDHQEAAAAAPRPAEQEEAARRSTEAEEAAARQQKRKDAEARRQSVEAVRRSQDMLAASITLEAKRKEKQQAALRLAAELKRREADLLERQLEQQRSLLARLESPALRPAERETLLTALRALQAASLSTRAGLTASLETTQRGPPRPGQRRAHPPDSRHCAQTEQPAAKLSAGHAQTTEREVLDLELALYQRQQAGAETEELQRRLSDLRRNAAPTRGRGRGTRVRGRGRGRTGRAGLLRPPPHLTRVDRRPATLIVSDFAEVGREAVITHLTRFGEVKACRPAGDPGSLAVTFGSRRQAEVALAGGATVGTRRLTLGWLAGPTVAAADAQRSSAEADTTHSAAEGATAPYGNLSDYEDDDGEDADDEDERSWRP